MIRSCLILITLLVIRAGQAVAQDYSVNDQLWVDGRVFYRLSSPVSVEADPGVRVQLSGPGEWTKLVLRGTVRYSVNPWLQLNGGLFFDHTDYSLIENTFEVRPTLGVLLRFYASARLRIDSFTRWEWRHISLLDSGEEKSTMRFRSRLGVVVAVSGSNLRGDRLFYAISDAEPFIDLSDDPEAIFANRLRVRAGLGYRLSYNWRFEFIYTWQGGRPEREHLFDHTDNILRLRVKHHIN